jgi:hypothetical protein
MKAFVLVAVVGGSKWQSFKFSVKYSKVYVCVNTYYITA